MAIYSVDMSCGHKQTVNLNGDVLYVARRRVLYKESGLCDECLNDKNSQGCREVSMSYRRFKNDFSWCNYKRDSYDSIEKTITVYVPNK